MQSKNYLSKIINILKIPSILTANHYYVFPCYNVRGCSFTCITHEIQMKHAE